MKGKSPLCTLETYHVWDCKIFWRSRFWWIDNYILLRSLSTVSTQKKTEMNFNETLDIGQVPFEKKTHFLLKKWGILTDLIVPPNDVWKYVHTTWIHVRFCKPIGLLEIPSTFAKILFYSKEDTAIALVFINFMKALWAHLEFIFFNISTCTQNCRYDAGRNITTVIFPTIKTSCIECWPLNFKIELYCKLSKHSFRWHIHQRKHKILNFWQLDSPFKYM